MSIESAKEFWERAKTNPEIKKLALAENGGILGNMDKIRELGYDFSKEEMHQAVVAPGVLKKMEQAKADNIPMTKELMTSFFDECSSQQLSDDQLDQVSGGAQEISGNSCSWPCHGGPTS
jgi:hypothetical protein